MEENESLIVQQTGQIEPFFYPEIPPLAVSKAYEPYMALRSDILSVVRNDSEAKKKLINDIADTLMDYEKDLPQGVLAAIKTVLTLGKTTRDRRKKREAFCKTVNALLEMVFDPMLEFKMTQKDIMDAFEANGIERDKISSQQIGQVYVKVLFKLKAGELRDLTYEQQIYGYVRLKITEITLSRQSWELNGR